MTPWKVRGGGSEEERVVIGGGSEEEVGGGAVALVMERGFAAAIDAALPMEEMEHSRRR